MGGRGWTVHLIRVPLEFVNIVEARVHEEGVQVPSFLGEACDAIAALLGSAKFDLEGGLVAGVDDAEVVGHRNRKRRSTGSILACGIG